MIVGFYARVSTEEQRERSTIDAQVEYARRRAELEGWDLRLFLDDGISGTIPLRERPAGGELLRAAAAHELQVVATYKLDRLGRLASVIHEAVAQLERLGVSYRSLTEPFDTATPAGTLFMQMLAAFAQFDRAVFLERSRAGTERVARLPGRWLGGIVPYGYRKAADGMLVVDDAEAAIVRDVFARCAVDGWSTVRISEYLNARSIPTSYARDGREFLAGEILGTRAQKAGKRRRATAGRWSAGAVLRLLHNPTYRGEHVYGRRGRASGERITRTMPAIVDAVLWRRAQQQLVANDRWNNRGATRTYLLRGLIGCGCGHALLGSSYPTRAGDQRVYRCNAHPKTERAVALKAEAIETVVWADIARFLAQPTETVETIVRGRGPAAKTEHDSERALRDVAAAITELESVEARALELYLHPDGKAITPALLARKVDETRAELVRLRQRQAELRDRRRSAAKAGDEAASVHRVLERLAAAVRVADPATKQRVMRELVAGVTIRREAGRLLARVAYRFGGDGGLARLPAIDARAATPETRASSARASPMRSTGTAGGSPVR